MLPSPFSPPDLEPLLATAREAAERGAAVHARWYDRPDGRQIREKGTADFVSAVDLEAQASVLALIRSRFPDHGILAEEDEEAGGADRDADWAPGTPIWVVDPLDGTTNFLHRHPAFCASVGVVVDGTPLVGAVTAAATGETWWAARGLGAFRNGRPLRVSVVDHLQGCLIGTGFPFKHPDEIPGFLRQLEAVLPRSSGVRRLGSAALDLCYLAQGSLDAFWEGRLSPWDVAAGLAILQEAGGVWSRLDGTPHTLLEEGGLLAAGSRAILEQLGDALS